MNTARRILAVGGVADGAERDERFDLPHVFTLRDIPDMDRFATFVDERKPRRAVVIGGGFIGLA